MLTPGIYYPNKNAHRQMLNTLPGKQVYPVDSNYLPYTEEPVLYANQVPQYPAGSSVEVYINGVLSGTTLVLDSSGLYVYELKLPGGAVEIKSVFPDGQTATQNYFCVNLYGALAASSDVWADARRANLQLISSQFLTPQTDGILRGQVDQSAMSDNFGEVLGFPQPFDWSFEQYALTLGGDPATGRPGVYGAKTKGSSTGAIKDVVQAVTGYTMSDQDFRGLQGIGWQLGRAGIDDVTILANYNFDNPGTQPNPPFPVSVTVTGATAGADYFNWAVGVTGTTGATSGTGRRVLSTEQQAHELVPNWGIYAQFGTVVGHEIGDSWSATILGAGITYTDTSYARKQPYRYRYSGATGAPVLDTDPTGANGPHYYLPYNQYSVALLTEADLSEPIVVSVNDTVIAADRVYAISEAGVTTVWIKRVATDDHVVIQYTGLVSGDPELISTIVPQITGLAPIATLHSGIQQANTLLLNIVHDGFFVNGESVIRGASGAADYLNYNWLNPWGVNEAYVPPELQWRHEVYTVGATMSHTFTTAHVPQTGSEFVTVNGAFLYPSQYSYSTPTTLEIDPSVDLQPDDIVQWDYRQAGQLQANHEETVVTPAFPYVITLPASPMPRNFGVSVFVNGVRMQGVDFVIVDNVVTIPAVINVGDRLCVRYYTSGLNSFGEIDFVGIKQDFVFEHPIDADSVIIHVNGQRVREGMYTLTDLNTVHLLPALYNQLEVDDRIAVTADMGVPAGYSVRIVQGAAVYDQGVSFKVDYTYGKILWITGQPQPVPGTAYLAYYIYFPKQIIEKLLNLVKPAPIKLITQFTTTASLTFNPFQWEGKDNPTGSVILPQD